MATRSVDASGDPVGTASGRVAIDPSLPRTPPAAGRRGSNGARRTAARPPWGRWGLRGLALFYLGLMIALPIVAVVIRGFGHGFSDLAAAFDSPGAWKAIQLTLILAAATAVINGVFGTLIAYVLVRYRFPGRGALSTIVDVPFAIPTLVTGVMLRALYGPSSPIGGFLEGHGIHVIFAPLGILLALLFVTLPLVVRTVQPVMLELDRSEEEASHVLGAGRIRTARSVVLPHLRPAIAAGCLLVFARAIGEFGAVVIVSGNIIGKTLTAPVFIFGLISQFKPEQAAAVAALLFGLSFVLVLITERLVGHRTKDPAE
jgi:sulfate/thiosulfate transport system permease protein